jgi:hypothetical protein
VPVGFDKHPLGDFRGGHVHRAPRCLRRESRPMENHLKPDAFVREILFDVHGQAPFLADCF